MQEKKLLMTFKNTLGNTFTLTIDDPSDDLTEQNIIDAMNLIKEKNKDKKEWQNLSAENYELLAGFFFIAYQ